MKKILLLLSSLLVFFLLTSCDQLPTGKGNLIVELEDPDTETTIRIYPYGPLDATMEPIVERKIKNGIGSASFTLNVGNYLVSRSWLRYGEGVQIQDGETTTVVLHKLI